MIAQLGDGSPIAGEISEVWFDVATRRMDAMQTIEVALTEALTQQANSKVADAKNEMANHQQLLTRFNDEHATDGSPLTLLFDPSMPGLAEDTKEDEIKTLSLNPKYPRPEVFKQRLASKNWLTVWPLLTLVSP